MNYETNAKKRQYEGKNHCHGFLTVGNTDGDPEDMELYSGDWKSPV